MLGLLAFLATLASFTAAQQTSFAPGTGVRSLWIPFKTVSGTPLASVAGKDESQNATVYVISCPTAQANCAIAPNLTVTEADSSVKYTTSNSAGAAVLDCTLTGTTTGTCHQRAQGGDSVQATAVPVAGNQIVYQAIDVTQTINNTSTLPATITVTAQQSTTSSTSSSTAGAQTRAGPWAAGGALGAGLLALAAL